VGSVSVKLRRSFELSQKSSFSVLVINTMIG